MAVEMIAGLHRERAAVAPIRVTASHARGDRTLAPSMKRLEFWPDYAGALLWSADGERVSLEDVPISSDLIEQARRWIAGYDDSKLPWEPTREDTWVTEGRSLFADLRRELLEHGFDLQPNEDFWAEPSGAEDVPPDDSGGP